MADRIKMENIVPAGFDTETGDEFVNLTDEYVCSNCRHLVGKNDKYCSQCGELLKDTGAVEHWEKGEELTGKKFEARVKQLTGATDA